MAPRPISARHLRWALLVGILGILPLAGCGSRAPQTFDIWGEVTFDGKPLPAGRIYFNPDLAKKNDGPQGYAIIRDGRYDTRLDGSGACGGPTVVLIQGYDGGKDAGPGTMGNLLFKEFSQAVDLPKESGKHDFAVPASAAKDLPKSRRNGRKP